MEIRENNEKLFRKIKLLYWQRKSVLNYQRNGKFYQCLSCNLNEYNIIKHFRWTNYQGKERIKSDLAHRTLPSRSLSNFLTEHEPSCGRKMSFRYDLRPTSNQPIIDDPKFISHSTRHSKKRSINSWDILESS